MSYTGKRWRFRNAIEVEEYHTARYGAPGQQRVKRRKATPEEMERVNQYNREKTARRKLREHFDVHDYFTTLTYKRDERPEDMIAAKDDFKKFIREVRKRYKKHGYVLKWMRNIEVGTKKGWHIHLIINRYPETDEILAEAWKKGKVVNQLMYKTGEFAKLAAYITKTPKTDPRLRESDYSTSRNLPIPEPDKKVYDKWETWGKVRVPKGFYVDPDSFHEGVNPLTGYKYRHYTLIRISRRC